MMDVCGTQTSDSAQSSFGAALAPQPPMATGVAPQLQQPQQQPPRPRAGDAAALSDAEEQEPQPDGGEGAGCEADGAVADNYIKGTRLRIGGWFQACRCGPPAAGDPRGPGGRRACSARSEARPAWQGWQAAGGRQRSRAPSRANLARARRRPGIPPPSLPFPPCRGCSEPTAHTFGITGRDVPLCPRCAVRWSGLRVASCCKAYRGLPWTQLPLGPVPLLSPLRLSRPYPCRRPPPHAHLPTPTSPRQPPRANNLHAPPQVPDQVLRHGVRRVPPQRRRRQRPH